MDKRVFKYLTFPQPRAHASLFSRGWRGLHGFIGKRESGKQDNPVALRSLNNGKGFVLLKRIAGPPMNADQAVLTRIARAAGGAGLTNTAQS